MHVCGRGNTTSAPKCQLTLEPHCIISTVGDSSFIAFVQELVVLHTKHPINDQALNFFPFKRDLYTFAPQITTFAPRITTFAPQITTFASCLLIS